MTKCVSWTVFEPVPLRLQHDSLHITIDPKKKHKCRREGKHRRGHGWEHILTAWTPHLSFITKDDLKKDFWENIHFGRVVVWNMVWTWWSSTSSKHPFRQVAFILFIPFFKLSWCQIASASSPQAAATTFAFYSVFILFLCLDLYAPTSMARVEKLMYNPGYTTLTTTTWRTRSGTPASTSWESWSTQESMK